MRERVPTTLILAGVLCVLWSGWSFPRDVEPHMALEPEAIVGVAFFPDGETPVADLPVRLWDVARKRFIYRSRTDKKGVFNVPNLQGGMYSLLVGRVKIDLWVLAKETKGLLQHHDIVVVVPRKMVVGLRPELFEIIVAPALIRPPDPPRVVSP